MADDHKEPYTISRTSTTYFTVLASDSDEAEAIVDRINDKVGTLMIDTTDWRFSKIDLDDIVEIYSEVA